MLIAQGHKRLLLVAGESYPNGLKYVLDALEAIYSLKLGNGEIRRINVNLAPLSVDEFRQLHEIGIGTYQLFQETYQRDVYAAAHLAGKKRDMDWRLSAPDRAMQAGIDDIGLGVLFGLGDWRFDVLALMNHAAHLEATYGAGCHTISVPRIEPAHGSDFSRSPWNPVSDDGFQEAGRHPAPRRALYRPHHVNPRDGPDAARDLCPRRLADLGRQPDQSRRLCGACRYRRLAGRCRAGGLRRKSVLARRSPSARRRGARAGRAGLYPVLLHRLLPQRTHRRGLHALGQDRRHQAKCGPNSVGTFMEYLLDYGQPETVRAGEAGHRARSGRDGRRRSGVSRR